MVPLSWQVYVQDVAVLTVAKHAVVSATPMGVEALRRSDFSTLVAYLIPASKTLLEENLRRKQETPERLTLMRQAATTYEHLPEAAYDIAVRVKSLVEAESELEEKLRARIELH